MLEVTDLVKTYSTRGNEPAGGVFGVSFALRPGELFTLLGPSGCGKTTTLRCVAGLEHPEGGTIRLGTQALFDATKRTQVPVYDRDIGMVFQSYAIWPHMSVFENAAYPLRVRRRGKPSRSEIASRVKSVLEAVGLAEYQSRSATQLSGGQQQRLAMARALVREPKLLLLDEPLSNLDAKLRDQMRGELKRIQAASGVTTIYVTHDQAEAMAISDRIAVLDKGRIVQIGAPEEIYDRPRSEFVANFIGRANLFRGRLERAASAGEVAPLASDLGRLTCFMPAKAPAGLQVSFVVRPEHVRLVGGALADGPRNDNWFEGRVESRTYLGELAEYVIALDGSQRILARASGATFTNGDRVSLHLPPDKTVAIAE
jgi:iron(III) transport system ATP-binding protein